MTPDTRSMPAMVAPPMTNRNDHTYEPATRTGYAGPWPPSKPAGFVASGEYLDPCETGSRPNENSRYEKDKITRERVAHLMGLRSQYSPQSRGDWVLQAFKR